MGGGLVQLVANKTTETDYLIGNPEITFFKIVYRRHTNFSIDTFEDTFSNSNSFGTISECRLKDYGDLISDIMIKIDLPSLNSSYNRLNNLCTKNISDTCECIKCSNENKTIYFCGCKHSKNGMFCDGSHKDTGITPLKFTVTAAEKKFLCGCKASKNKPFCDGTHKAL